jgi:hypothetical protein
MKRRALAIASVLVTLLLAGSSLSNRVSARQAVPGADGVDAKRLIRALNDCLQDRFRDVDERFGIRRVIAVGETPHRFKPENVRELSAFEGLERARSRVVLYLAGRRALRVNVDPSNATRGSMWALIKGPVLVTPVDPAAAIDATSDPPPEPVLMLAETRRAMAAFTDADAHEFVIGRWKFVSHPVRASEATCLSCHRERSTAMTPTPASSGTPLEVGDPLGIVLYGYQPVK